MLFAATPLPPDAQFVELRPEVLTFRTREALLPGTLVQFTLVLENHPMSLKSVVEACLVVDRDRTGYVFHIRLPLTDLPSIERHLISLFIGKGRGAPSLIPTAQR
jgi:hypothetical protein